MKLLLLCGDQPRHLYLVSEVARRFTGTSVIFMRRESMSPEPPLSMTVRDLKLFKRHFENRREAESAAFGTVSTSKIGELIPTHAVSPVSLNSQLVVDLIDRHQPDVCLVFGTDLIKSPVIDVLPALTFNVHLGLSPWYRGSATLFWPFYFMEPQCAGVTVHQLIREVDAGNIVFQCVPMLSREHGIHQVACEAVKTVIPKLIQMLETIESGKVLHLNSQKSTGRLFRTRDFRPEHLRVNYEIFDDRMTASWLDGDLGGSIPHLAHLSDE